MENKNKCIYNTKKTLDDSMKCCEDKARLQDKVSMYNGTVKVMISHGVGGSKRRMVNYGYTQRFSCL